jgi:LysR family glycine cleavage system transcriptional activator
MPRRLPSLTALRAFEAAARHNSFRLAADELHVTPAAVSYQISMLEDFLGVELFRREDRAMYLTKAGQTIAAGVSEGFERISETLEKLDKIVKAKKDNRKCKEVLTLEVAPAFAVKWLIPRLHSFANCAPDIDVRIEAKRELSNFRDSTTDVAIRFGQGRYSGLRAEKLFGEALTPICSPYYSKKGGGRLQSPDELRHEILIHDDSYFFMDTRPDWDMWLKAANVAGVDTTVGPRFSHWELVVQAAMEGCGVALGRVSLTAADVAAGRLIYPFDLIVPLDLGYFLVGPHKTFNAAKVAKFRAWLLQEVADSGRSMVHI